MLLCICRHQACHDKRGYLSTATSIQWTACVAYISAVSIRRLPRKYGTLDAEEEWILKRKQVVKKLSAPYAVSIKLADCCHVQVYSAEPKNLCPTELVSRTSVKGKYQRGSNAISLPSLLWHVDNTITALDHVPSLCDGMPTVPVLEV